MRRRQLQLNRKQSVSVSSTFVFESEQSDAFKWTPCKKNLTRLGGLKVWGQGQSDIHTYSTICTPVWSVWYIALQYDIHPCNAVSMYWMRGMYWKDSRRLSRFANVSHHHCHRRCSQMSPIVTVVSSDRSSLHCKFLHPPQPFTFSLKPMLQCQNSHSTMTTMWTMCTTHATQLNSRN